MQNSNYFPPLLYAPRTKPRACFRLICFPYAGGCASAFLEWERALSPDLELVVVQMPGRGVRFLEPPYQTMQDLVYDLIASLERFRDKPFIFFGHSMGARVAYELTLTLYRYQRKLPIHFISSASSSPNSEKIRDPIHQLPDREFLKMLASMQGTSEEVLQNEEIMRLLIPSLRADFKIIENYSTAAKVVLPCGISVFAGDKDDIKDEQLKAWFPLFKECTGIHMISGGHFFIRKNSEGVLSAIKGITKSLLR